MNRNNVNHHFNPERILNEVKKFIKNIRLPQVLFNPKCIRIR